VGAWARLGEARGRCGYLPGIEKERALEPLGGWSVLFRGRFETRHEGQQDEWLARFLEAGPGWRLREDALTLTSGETAIELEATGAAG
jgi:hypothetical protein